MATTWGQMFGLVLRDSGVAAQGQTPNAQMSNDAKLRCNMMISQWRRRRWLVYHLVDTSAPCDGSLFYDIGIGETFNVTRPDQIQAAYMRQLTTANSSGPVDYPLTLIHSREDYSTITLKNMQAGPSWYLFLDSDYPVGHLYPWPLANNQYELHVLTKCDLPEIVNFTDDILLPPEYELAIYSNSVCMTRAAFFLPQDPEFKGIAKASLETLRSSNFQIGVSRMPSAVLPMTGGGYNIFADRYGPAGR